MQACKSGRSHVPKAEASRLSCSSVLVQVRRHCVVRVRRCRPSVLARYFGVSPRQVRPKNRPIAPNAPVMRTSHLHCETLYSRPWRGRRPSGHVSARTSTARARTAATSPTPAKAKLARIRKRCARLVAAQTRWARSSSRDCCVRYDARWRGARPSQRSAVESYSGTVKTATFASRTLILSSMLAALASSVVAAGEHTKRTSSASAAVLRSAGDRRSRPPPVERQADRAAIWSGRPTATLGCMPRAFRVRCMACACGGGRTRARADKAPLRAPGQRDGAHCGSA